ncbi:response regulator, partial [Corallococcus praedator]|uniref:response regulator n=1 Tax=Corallococcus praedator TaxID=2316724 RepID=UPI001ABF652D
MILIIEDEHALAAALGTVCKRLGHEARLCSSGQRGLDELASGEFALAILDIGLPDMSGLVVLEQIRQRAPRLPALIITAHGNLDNAVAAKQLGAAAYLVKPLDLREVQETLRQL